MKSRLNQSFIAAWLFCIGLATSCKKDTPAPAALDGIKLTEKRVVDKHHRN